MENLALINFHRTRDFSAKMNVTFEFIRQNFKSLSLSILFIAGPPVVVASLFLGSFMNDFMAASLGAGVGGDPDVFRNLLFSTTFWLQLSMMMLFLVLSMVATIATINNYLMLYETEKTNQIPVALVWERVRNTLGMYLGTIILFVTSIFFGYFVLAFIIGATATVIGGFSVLLFIGSFIGLTYVMVAGSMIFIVRGYEKIGFVEGLSRSFALIKGKWWSTFGLVFILSLIGGVLSYIFMIPWYAITIVSAVHDTTAPALSESGSNMGTLAMVFFTLYYMAQMLLQSLPNLGLAFQYFNLVEMKEARGLISQIEAIGQEPAKHDDSNEHY